MSAELPLPVNETIVLRICDELRGISTQNGYRNNVSEVVRPAFGEGNPVKDRQLIVYQGDPTELKDGALGYTTWLMPVVIRGTVLESEDSSVVIDQRLNTLWADVIKRMIAEGESDITHGGYAVNTVVADPEYAPIEVGGKRGSVAINIAVTYRHVLGNPYKLTVA